MTVLELDEDNDSERAQNPPKKKICLSLNPQLSSARLSQKKLEKPRSSSHFLDSTKMLSEFQQRIPSNSHSNKELNSDLPANLITSNLGQKLATLCNLGNTCFLNSVLYTLRCTPSFLHNLHHLSTDLSLLSEKQLQNKSKISSLTRIGISSSLTHRTWSNKDLPSLNSDILECKPKIQIATEKLHELFVCLRDLEIKENSEPFQPDAFLQALRDVNPIFEGNQQQDAHELLVCLLDNIRESFQFLVKHRENHVDCWRPVSPSLSTNNQIEASNNSGKRSARKSSLKKKKNSFRSASNMIQTTLTSNVTIQKPSASLVENGRVTPPIPNGDIRIPENKKCFISEDIEGISLLRTTCLECEQVTERKETFCDICVPVDSDRCNDKDQDDHSAIYRKAIVTSELLVDKNKYWCATCLRYNEARRAVCYPTLPRLLILQLKRFSTMAGSMEKINNHMPTPLTLQCFCEDCNNDQAKHTYNLYSVIMHQGATMTAGHYVAYTRLPTDSSLEYINCDRDKHQQKLGHNNVSATDNSKITALFNCFGGNKPNDNKELSFNNKKGCRSQECCGMRHTSRIHDNIWLECDDEAVRVIPLHELQQKLGSNSRNSATPYLLFYVRSIQNSAVSSTSSSGSSSGSGSSTTI